MTSKHRRTSARPCARDFIRGMGRVGQRFVIVLDPDRAFDVDDMAQLCERSQLAEAA